jgi:hypothetical protein
MRKVGAALLFMAAGACLLLAFFALDTLWDEYKDSADSIYIETAALFAAIGLGFGGLGALLLRGR